MSNLFLTWKMGQKFIFYDLSINFLLELVGEEGKLWDKAWQARWAPWRAQDAHIHTPKEGRAHPFTWAPD